MIPLQSFKSGTEDSEMVTEDSEMVISEILMPFKRSKATFFHKVMGKSSATEVVKGPFAYQLEFPSKFLTEHAHEFAENAILERPDCDKTWPLAITVRSFRHTKTKRVFAYGCGGWKAFVMDNEIKVGDLLVFTLVAFSRFLVHFYTAVNDTTPHNDVKPGQPTWPSIPLSSQESFYGTLDESRCTTCGQAAPSPRFVTTVRLLHTPHNDISGKQDVPASFWQRHRRMLRSDKIQLQGSNKAVMKVTIRRYYSYGEMQPRVRLESGWKAFFVANHLQSGDHLVFSLIGPSRFKVDVMDRF